MASQTAAKGCLTGGEGIWWVRAGYAAPSFGLHCAAMAGMKPDVLERAQEVMSVLLSHCTSCIHAHSSSDLLDCHSLKVLHCKAAGYPRPVLVLQRLLY